MEEHTASSLFCAKKPDVGSSQTTKASEVRECVKAYVSEPFFLFIGSKNTKKRNYEVKWRNDELKTPSAGNSDEKSFFLVSS